MNLLETAKEVKKLSKEINLASSEKKNLILKNLKDNIKRKEEEVLKENEKDVGNSKKEGLSLNLIERLTYILQLV